MGGVMKSRRSRASARPSAQVQSDPEVIRYGILYMKIVAFAQIPLAITMM